LTVSGNYAKVAEGLNVASTRVEKPAAIVPAIKDAVAVTETAAPFCSNSSLRKATTSLATPERAATGEPLRGAVNVSVASRPRNLAVAIEYRYAAGRFEEVAKLVDDLVRRQVTVTAAAIPAFDESGFSQALTKVVEIFGSAASRPAAKVPDNGHL